MQPEMSRWDADNPEYLGRLCGQMFRMAEVLRDWHYEYFQTSHFMKHFVYKDAKDWPTLKKHYYAACHSAKGNVMELEQLRRPGDDFDNAAIDDWLLGVQQSRNRMYYKRMNRDTAQIPVGDGTDTIGIITRELREG